MKRDNLLRASARCWQRAGRLDRAAERFSAAGAWAEAGRCWAEAGRHVDAAEAYGRADEPVFEARQWLTSPWPERARRPYRRALEADLSASDEVEALLGLGELDLALERSLGLPEDDGQRLEALRGVAGIAAARGRPDLASRAWAQAIARSPGSAGEIHRAWERSSLWNRSLRWERPASRGASGWPSRTFTDVRLELLWEEEIEILNGYGNRALAWSEDGKRFAAARGEKGLTLGDVMGEEVRLQSLDLKVFSVDYVPQVDSVLVGLLGGAVGRVDGSGSHEEVEALRMPNNIWGIAFSPRGDRVAVTNYQNPGALLRVWAWGPQGPHELLREEQVPEGKTNPSCAWSPDGWILAWCPGPWVEDIITNDVYLLSPEATRCVSAAHKNVISGLSFSPDGDYLVTASWDRTLVLRDARTAEAIASPWSCAQRLHTSVFHPHAALLAAGGTEELGVCFKQPSRLYLLRFSQEEHPQIEVVQEHATDSAVCSVAFSPNGEQLLMMTKNHLSLFRVHLI